MMQKKKGSWSVAPGRALGVRGAREQSLGMPSVAPHGDKICRDGEASGAPVTIKMRSCIGCGNHVESSFGSETQGRWMKEHDH